MRNHIPMLAVLVLLGCSTPGVPDGGIWSKAPITGNGNEASPLTIEDKAIGNERLKNSGLTLKTSDGLLGGGMVALGESVTLGIAAKGILPSMVAGGSYGIDVTGTAAGFTGMLAGDVTGTQAATKVERLQNQPVEPGTEDGQVLTFSGGAWAPRKPTDLMLGNVSGLGTTGALAKFTGASSIADSVLIERAGLIGLGTVAPGSRLHIARGDSPAFLMLESTLDKGTINADWALKDAAGKGSDVVRARLAVDRSYNHVGNFHFLLTDDQPTLREVVTIDGLLGRVGIGTTIPFAPLHVIGKIASEIKTAGVNDSAGFGLYNDLGNDGGLFVGSSAFTPVPTLRNRIGLYTSLLDGISIVSAKTGGDIRFLTNGTNTERMRITSDGNVVIGGATPDHRLSITGATKANAVYVGTPGFADRNAAFGSDQWDNIIVREPTRGPGGWWGMAVQIADAKAHTGDFHPFIYTDSQGTPWGGGSVLASINKDGGAYFAGQVACVGGCVNGSSRSIKEHIEDVPIGEALGAFGSLRPKRFAYKANPTEPKLGFIAEDVPDLVAMNDRKSLDPMEFAALLTKVVQEQQKQLGDQQKQLAGERRRNDDLQRRIERLEAALAKSHH